ncbi:hypothetical protein [Caryophanon latum]|uniref:Uncharacterized protein n=1 Tax=Caryophanon latum TaxID=33977 RepID=A0A1C0YYA4_9BACL|nr:hypothetical protein [Caryophanon latum]OCS92112.1 hypothetical protein A6K76_07645 [Caryophanon latum]
MKEAEIVAVLTLLAERDDVIYEVFKLPKRSKTFYLWDIFCDLLPGVINTLLKQQTVYLIACERSGTFIELDRLKVVRQTVIPNWSPHMKHSFSTMELDGYVYKKYRVLK